MVFEAITQFLGSLRIASVAAALQGDLNTQAVETARTVEPMPVMAPRHAPVDHYQSASAPSFPLLALVPTAKASPIAEAGGVSVLRPFRLWIKYGVPPLLAVGIGGLAWLRHGAEQDRNRRAAEAKTKFDDPKLRAWDAKRTEALSSPEEAQAAIQAFIACSEIIDLVVESGGRVPDQRNGIPVKEYYLKSQALRERLCKDILIFFVVLQTKIMQLMNTNRQDEAAALALSHDDFLDFFLEHRDRFSSLSDLQRGVMLIGTICSRLAAKVLNEYAVYRQEDGTVFLIHKNRITEEIEWAH